MTRIRYARDHLHARVGRTVQIHITGGSAAVHCTVPFFSTEQLEDLWRLFNLERFRASAFAWYGCNTGRGIFSTGGHLQHMLDNPSERGLRSYGDMCTRLIKALLNHPHQTTAVVSGGCYGGGLESALACEHFIAGPYASLQFPEFHFNAFPGMGGRLFADELTEACLDELNEGGIVRGPVSLHRTLPRALVDGATEEPITDETVIRRVVDAALDRERDEWVERMSRLVADPVERRKLEIRAKFQERMNCE